MEIVHRRLAFQLAVFTALCVPRAARAADSQHVLAIVGAPGTSDCGRQFHEWAERWRLASGLAGAGFQLIGRDESGDDRTAVEKAVKGWASVSTVEPLWIVLIGHGTHDGRTTRFNLRGPDITAVDIAGLLSASQRPIALINCTSCSAPFINAASGEGRVIITATKNAAQHQFARFGDAFSAAMITLDADLDQDGQISLLEAWAFASQRTAEFYESQGRLATEQALLDDNGDGLGVRAAAFSGVRLQSVSDPDNPDGRLARRWHLVRSSEERKLTVEQRQQRDQLEERLEGLRRRREEYTETEYLDRLESILLPLARLYESASVSIDARTDADEG